MTFSNLVRVLLHSSLFVALLCNVTSVKSKYPSKVPFMDACIGKKKPACIKTKGCTYSERSFGSISERL